MEHPGVTLDRSRALTLDVLRSYGDLPALVDATTTLTYRELVERVEDRMRRLGPRRRLVAAIGSQDTEFVVTFLAALAGRHPLIVVDDERRLADVDARFEPDVVIRSAQMRFAPERTDDRMLHPDLALLLSTSGSTGATKFVRLSTEAVGANAEAIAASLDLADDDRAITSLPLHYCYGLSILTSHLGVGASVVLTDLSVVDPCFWQLVTTTGVTGLSGVPFTFEMLERVGTDVLDVATLRRVTQAGGRMAPERVRRFADLGRRFGWELFVMYGQTEATARMAVLDPGDIDTTPGSVGRAIARGSIRIDTGVGVGQDSPAGAGEIVYTGPNVMMGYATSVNDLARGHDIDELRTGDLGVLDEAGRLTVVGRMNRFSKIHGRRIDLDDVEAELAVRRRGTVVCVGDDDVLAVVDLDASCVDAPTLDPALAELAAEITAVPVQRVVAVRLGALPRTASGKVDGPELLRNALELRDATRSAVAGNEGAGRVAPPTVAGVFRLTLGVEHVDPTQSFASLGGDSFSYVETSVHLERLLGTLPPGWHLMSVSALELVADGRPERRRWTTQLDTSVVVRAICILLIVCTHMGLYRVAGGAHALLAVVGFNLARFQLSSQDMAHRLRSALTTIARVAVPTSVWIGINMMISGGYSVGSLLLVNNYFGSGHRTGGRWEYWYFEAFVQLLVVFTVVFSSRRVRRLERAAPFAFAVGVLGLTWLFRFDLVEFGHPYNEVFRPHTIASFLALGWCAHRARTVAQRLFVTALIGVTTFGFFESVGYVDQLDRELRVMAMIAALVWLPTVRIPRPLATVTAWLAGASMYIFLVHWQIWPLFTPWMDDRAAYVATIAVGVVVWRCVLRSSAIVRQWRRTPGRSTSTQVRIAETTINRSDATPVSA